MGRDKHGIGRNIEGDPEQLLRIEPQDRPAVGLEVADLRQGAVQAFRALEVRREDDGMHLPRLAVLAVDAADLGGKDERDICLAGCGNIVGPILFLESEQTIAERVKLLLQFFDPLRMGEVSGADDA